MTFLKATSAIFLMFLLSASVNAQQSCHLTYPNGYSSAPVLVCSEPEPSYPYEKNYAKYSRSGDNIVDKPVIFVEGYDPFNERSETSYRNSVSPFYSDNSGRDVFVVNFPDGADSLDANARLLKGIIKEINRKKEGNHPLAVIGYSMGGVVARKALYEMELNGEDHQTSLYVSYDSPHLGANVPKSIEETVNSAINKLRFWGIPVPSVLKGAKHLYNSPAAREMLYWGADYSPAYGRTSFPSNLARIAVTSGSDSGQKQAQSVVNGEVVARFSLLDETLVSYMSNTVLKSKKRNRYGEIGEYYDNVPGSYGYPFDEFMGPISTIGDVYEYNENKRVVFVSTLSALAIDNFELNASAEQVFDFSPFDDYIGGSSNLKHEIIYSSHMQEVREFLYQYHRKGAHIPSRVHKREPYRGLVQNIYYLRRAEPRDQYSWPAVAGADFYEVYRRGGFLFATTGTTVSNMGPIPVDIRACRRVAGFKECYKATKFRNFESYNSF